MFEIHFFNKKKQSGLSRKKNSEGITSWTWYLFHSVGGQVGRAGNIFNLVTSGIL